MPKISGGLNRDVLTAALEGLEAQKRRLEEQLQQVRSALGMEGGRRGRPPRSAFQAADGQAPFAGRPARKRRRLSAEARARISAAQKKRWAAAKRK